jgi:phosphate transport system permease protein
MINRIEVRRRVEARLAKRHRAERRFRIYGKIAVCVGLVFLGVLFATIVDSGANAFRQTKIAFDINPADGAAAAADHQGMIKRALR